MRDSMEGNELVLYNNINEYINSDGDMNIQMQLVVMYFVVKLSKERGINMDGFQRIITKLYALYLFSHV